MNLQLNEYIVTNVFCDIGENERKIRINKAIKNLCVLDIEKNIKFHYNTNVVFSGGVSDPKKGGTL